jgi:NACHT domain
MLALFGNTEEKFVLDRLRFVDNAAFDSHDEEHNARCYQGTRVELLRQIDSWASDRGNESIFWLNGMAGTGKSTISRTVAQNFAGKGDLGASFFFKRGDGNRGHAGLFIATIAVQLVQKVPSLAPHVRSAIEADLMISGRALKQQFDTLILHPLGKIQIDPPKSLRIVIVIDALDECDREEDIRIIIRLLSQAQRTAPMQLKFFLTSRPELPIRLGFEDIRGKYKGLILHQVPEPVVKEDISAFLEYELATIRDDYHKSVKSSRRQLPDNWPGHTNVQILVEMAFPLFIFAATVCRFINDRRCGQPDQQLAKVLKYQTKSQASKLNATYLPVLNQLLIGVTGSEKRVIVEQFKQVVGSIVILASPLPATSLDQLLGLPEGTVDSRTDLLHSVLSIPSDPNYPIRLLHLSFRDFLVNTERCETNPFWVDENQMHQMIANCCIELMSSSLKQNICGLESPGILKTEVASSRVDRCLPPEVKYACLYWIQHLQKNSTQLDDHGKAHQFLQAHLIHWLEALGWMGKASEGIQAIMSLEAHVPVSYLSIIYKSLTNLSLD